MGAECCATIGEKHELGNDQFAGVLRGPLPGSASRQKDGHRKETSRANEVHAFKVHKKPEKGDGHKAVNGSVCGSPRVPPSRRECECFQAPLCPMKSGEQPSVHVQPILEFKTHEAHMRASKQSHRQSPHASGDSDEDGHKEISPAYEPGVRSREELKTSKTVQPKLRACLDSSSMGERQSDFKPAPVTGNFMSRFTAMRFHLEPELEASDTAIRLEREYEELEFIDRGSFGQVKKVRHRATNSIRALKIIRKADCQATPTCADQIGTLIALVPLLSSS